LRRLPAHSRPEPPVINIRAIAPSGTTFSTPVKAVPPGLTVVGATTGVLVRLVVEVIDVGLTVGDCVVVVVSVGSVVVVTGVVGVVTVVVPAGDVVVVVSVGTVVVVVSVGTVVVVVSVGTVVVVVSVGTVVVVVEVVVVVVVVTGVVVVVVVVVVPPSQCEMVNTGVGASPSPFQFHVADAVVLPAEVPGPGTSALKLFPNLAIENELPLTCKTTLLTSLAEFPNPARIHRVVPPEHGRFVEPFPVQGVDSALANAAVGKTAHSIISRVAADRAINPASESRRPCAFLRTGIPVSFYRGTLPVPPLAILRANPDLLHRSKAPDFCTPFGLAHAQPRGVYGSSGQGSNCK
jgi:hypothetical protein